MFENQSDLLTKINNPLSIASMALTEIEERLNANASGVTYNVADPNSPFCHLLEMNSSLVAAAIQAIEEKFPTLYPQRAASMTDLYQHMSDFDYLRMYSSPASTYLTYSLPKQYLLVNALDYNTNFKKVTIPKDSVFMVGRYTFGMYYPIDILINKFTKTVSATYDTTVSNPLHTLTRNFVDKYEYKFNGVDMIMLRFPIYQFFRSTIDEPVIVSNGFSMRLSYTNKFYAVRLYQKTRDTSTGKWVYNGELGQTQSEIVYDTSKPTALIRVLSDSHELMIHIPQIYLENGLVKGTIEVELFTTLGELHIDSSNLAGTMVSANFTRASKDTTEYSYILSTIPYSTPIALDGTDISGGSDAIDVDSLRERVVNSTLYEKVPVTEDEIETYLEDNNFYVKKYRDNITDRVYYAYRILQDADGNVIPSVTMQMKLLSSYTQDRSTFIQQSDGSITILPTTMYKFDSDGSTAIPLTNDEINRIKVMDKQQLVEEFANKQYFQTPFHLRIDVSNEYPEATSYDLMNPSVDRTIFDEENHVTQNNSKMTIYGAVIEHLATGSGGYRISMAIGKDGDLATLNEENILVYVAIKASNGSWIGGNATYLRDYNGRSIYTVDLKTNYRLTKDNEIAITNLVNENTQLTEYLIPLSTDIYVISMVANGSISNLKQAPTSLLQGVPTNLTNSYIGLTRQHMSVTLGISLDDVIKHDIETSSTSRVYATWDHDEPLLYEEDVYAYDNEGKIAITIEGDGVKTTLLHKAGDQVTDSDGTPVWAHRKGEIRYDASGEPIIATERDKVYYLTAIFIDSKVFMSEKSAELDFVSSLYKTLESYFDTIRTLQNQLLERTYVYFRAVRSTGTATFNLGDNVTAVNDIELSFKLNCYVPSYVKQDTDIQNQIIELICDSINEAMKTKELSMLDIFSYVKTKMSDYVDHFSLLGINGTEMQTFVIEDEDAQPSIARELTLSEDNVLSLTRQIDITFIALEDNVTDTSNYEA